MSTTQAMRPFELIGYPALARAMKILAWFDSQPVFPTAEQFQERFGGSRATAHRILNAIELEKGVDRPRRGTGGRGRRAHGAG
ncbi:hypothetical protein LJR143_002201 [Pseudoxanthomonas sp. LjRoot143]|uniref:hypothetical protein n=1 Tax=Pseudoxanthomonas sp. LjRoot143 TaxID=3342266 RepID=UPI003ECDA400